MEVGRVELSALDLAEEGVKSIIPPLASLVVIGCLRSRTVVGDGTIARMLSLL